MIGWEQDKRWSDRFLHEIKGILGQHLIGEPPVQEDQERNTDLIVLKMDAVRIACRIRKYSYWLQYQNEFTIREGRPSGFKTELTKIIEGWGDYLFYGFADAGESSLFFWRLLDLKVFRIELFRKLAQSPVRSLPGVAKANGDKSSTFRAFSIPDFPKTITVASGGQQLDSVRPYATGQG